MLRDKLIWIAVMASGLLLSGCGQIMHEGTETSQDQVLVNLSHLEHLYTEVEIDSQATAGVIHIYSEYPDYEYTIEPDEGFACVDDVARAVVFLDQAELIPGGASAEIPAGKSESIDLRDSTETDMERMRSLLPEFILAMQSDNGYFYNFLWGDLSINKTYRTSLPRADWWSWRAFWALESYPVRSAFYGNRSQEAIMKLVNLVYDEYLDQPMNTQTIEGVEVPTWLPHITAADQASLLIVGLCLYYKRTEDDVALALIDKFAAGMIMMQKGDSTRFPYGAYLSWKNMWHAYGNMQAYSMLKAGQLLNKEEYITSALLEIDHFYPYLMDRQYLSFFSVRRNDSAYEIIEEKQFPQIAYGIRPMVYACLEAYEITGEDKYLKRATRIAGWFTGDNPAGAVMYDQESGRCYDGIIDQDNINLNSGAESTIEALLSLQALQRYIENKQEYNPDNYQENKPDK